ncbi:MAG: DinB family protein [Bacteroidetes bacterium]|nr:DinB family protein [Bacteroidota bacterium]
MANAISRNLAIASRLREVLLNGRWIANTNYKEQIQSINWQQANQKVDNLNTIAALIYHINYYLAGLLSAFENGRLEISDKYSFDLPQIKSETDWNKLVTDFLSNSERFADRVEQMEDSIFDKPFIDEKYGTTLRNIEAVIEHSYYHLGQISLIKKLVVQNQP